MVASRHKLHNLHVVVDANGEQECGWGHDAGLRPEPVPDDAAKWGAFGWQVSECDGHDLDALRDWVVAQGAIDPPRPTVLLARTCKGFGSAAAVSGFRNHATHLTDDEFRAIEASLAGDGGGAR
jgi:transketolase